MRRYLTIILSTLTALAINIALDVYTDVPMLIRWAVAIVFSLLVTIALIKSAQRRQKRDSSEELNR